MSDDEKRTTKILKGTFTLTFHGDYVPLDDCQGRFEAWADAGFDDRPDLRNWEFTVTDKAEIDGDPEGYDGPPADEDDTGDGTECMAAGGYIYPEHDFPDDDLPCRRCDAEQAYLGDGS